MKNQDQQHPLTKEQRKARRRRRFLRTITVIIGLLVIIRIALPVVALRLINKKLAKMPDYICHVGDLDINLIGKSILLKDIRMKRKNGKIEIPFFTCNWIYVGIESFERRANIIKVDSCVMNLVKGASKETSQTSLAPAWRKLAKEMPLKPNTFIVNHGELHFIENYREAPIDLSLKNIEINGRNLKNLSADSSSFPSFISILGDLEGAKFKSEIKMNAQKKPLSLEAVSSFGPVDVKRIKNFLVVYAGFDVKSGTLAATSLIKIKNKRLDGSIDPVAKHLVFYDQEKDEPKKFGAKVKQIALQAAAKALDKPKTEKISTRIELHGPLGEVKLNVWQIIIDGLKRSIIPEPVPAKEIKGKESRKKESRKERRAKKKRKKKS